MSEINTQIEVKQEPLDSVELSYSPDSTKVQTKPEEIPDAKLDSSLTEMDWLSRLRAQDAVNIPCMEAAGAGEGIKQEPFDPNGKPPYR